MVHHHPPDLKNLPINLYDAIEDSGIPDADFTKLVVNLSTTHSFFNQLLKYHYEYVCCKRLAQAVIDNEPNLVKKILDLRPSRIQFNFPPNCVIRSHRTWQEFCDIKNVLYLTVKLKLPKMFKFLLPYYDKCQQTPELIKAKNTAISAWRGYEIKIDKDGAQEIIIPAEYAKLAKKIIKKANL